MNLLQQKDSPLFPDLLWSRPENKKHAGKLLIIGGQANQFTLASTCFNTAEKAGAGHTRVLLPSSLEKITQHFPGIEYAPSNQSGSFSKRALVIMNEMSEWADTVLLAGDIGKNSETTTVIDGYLLRCITPTVITEDSLASTSLPLEQLLKRRVILILEWSKFQKKVEELKAKSPFLSSDPINKTSDNLSQIFGQYEAGLVIAQDQKIWCTHKGMVSLTHTGKMVDLSRLSSYCSVWFMQHQNKMFEAVTSGCFEYVQGK